MQDRVNQRVYHRAGVERYYRSTQLSRVETMVLLKYAHAFVGRDVFDLGVGLGRTALYLAPLARRYEGIDYSPIMVEKARQADQMTQRRQLADQGFRMLDVLDHEGRSVTAAEETAASPTLMYVGQADK